MGPGSRGWPNHFLEVEDWVGQLQQKRENIETERTKELEQCLKRGFCLPGLNTGQRCSCLVTAFSGPGEVGKDTLGDELDIAPGRVWFAVNSSSRSMSIFASFGFGRR